MCVQYISWVHRGMFSTSGISWFMWGASSQKPLIYIESPNVLNIPHDVLSIPCTHDIPLMYSWYPPDVLMVSPRCTGGFPLMYSWYPHDVLNPPPLPDVLNIPNVLNTRYREYIGGMSWVHRGDIMIHVGSKLIKAFDLYWKPQCTEHPTISDVLMISPEVLSITHCTHDIPPMY